MQSEYERDDSENGRGPSQLGLPDYIYFRANLIILLSKNVYFSAKIDQNWQPLPRARVASLVVK